MTDDAPWDETGAGALLTIDQDALVRNYRMLAEAAAPARCAAVVKADAYGLGVEHVVSALHAAGCRAFFVAHLGEALAVKAHLGPDAALYVLNGLQPGAEALCADAGILPVLNGLDQVAAWRRLAARRGARLPAALQVDSGMSRLGLSPAEVERLAVDPALLSGIDVKLVMTHLACGDDDGSAFNAEQAAAFRGAAGRLPPAPLSIANSGGVFLRGLDRGGLARPGVALYGAAPIVGRPNPMHPVLRLDARVIQTRSVPAGASIGYGRSLVATRPMRLATIAVGYGDGWPRALSSVGAAYRGSVRLPIAGRVSMDSIILDVSGLPEDALGLGDAVELIGPNQTLEMVAADAGTIPYEILTGLGRRYARRILPVRDDTTESAPMKVTVLGSGVIGVTSAYYLAKAGHEVTVVDRQPAAALETSFANAGEISPGYASPWAAPGIPQKAVKWLLMKHAPLILRPTADPAMLSWLVRMLANCTAGRYAVNKARMVRVAEYSRDCLMALRAETGIRYDERMAGTLQVFRTQKQLDGIAKDIDVLRDGGVPFEVLDRAGCIAAEPALAHVRETIVGGLRLPNDETGDCFKFTQGLAAIAEGLGVVFRYGTEISRLLVEGGRVTAVETSAGRLAADLVVVALGSYSPKLLGPLGIHIPVYPVKGYSITAPIVDESRAPVSTVMDETYKIAITRLGDRIRVGGMAEISGFSTDLPPARRATLEQSVSDLFPGGDLKAATFWSGLRPMTPDGTPIIGATRYPGLMLNTGHGTLGWTMACGSARILADLVSGTRLNMDVSDLSMARYG